MPDKENNQGVADSLPAEHVQRTDGTDTKVYVRRQAFPLFLKRARAGNAELYSSHEYIISRSIRMT